jgi:hypothetical protein
MIIRIVFDRKVSWTIIKDGRQKKERPRENCLKQMQYLIAKIQGCVLVVKDKTFITTFKRR